MESQVSIHNLAVLRASVEGEHLGCYFGSWGALKGWIESTQAFGLIDAHGLPTAEGANVARALDLMNQGGGRAYLWPHATSLETQARALITSKPME